MFFFKIILLILFVVSCTLQQLVNLQALNHFFIITVEGKIYCYSFMNQKVRWVIDIKQKLFNTHFNDDSQYRIKKGKKFTKTMSRGESEKYLFPTIEGDFFYYSRPDGLHKINNDEIDSVILECSKLPGTNNKLYSYNREKTFLFDINDGISIDYDNQDENNYFYKTTKDLFVISVKQKVIKNFDMESTQEIWTVVSSEVNIFSYHNYFLNPSRQIVNNFRLHSDFIFRRINERLLEITSKDKTRSFQISTEQDIVFVSSLDQYGEFFKIELANNQKVFNIDDFINMANQHDMAIQKKEEIYSLSASDLIQQQYQQNQTENNNNCPEKLSKNQSDVIKCILAIQNKQFCQKKPIQRNQQNNTIRILIGLITLVIIFTKIKLFKYRELKQVKNVKCNQLNNSNCDKQHVKSSPQLIQNQDQMNSNSPSSESTAVGENSIESKTGRETNQCPDLQQSNEITININHNNNLIAFNKNEVLGYGSNGTVVYKGNFQDRTVAIKRVLMSHFHLACKEIQILLKLDHENIIKYYYYQEKKEFVYIVLEQCQFSLNRMIMEPQIRSILGNNIQQIMFDCIKGLQYLHSQDIIHRDIKPENILIFQTKERLIAKLADFAISKELNGELTYQTNNLGTYGWRAKEVILNQKKSKASDIFSLGCVFYYIMFDGKHPFGEQNERENRIIKNQFDKKILEKHPYFEDLILNMISKNRKMADQVLVHPFFWQDEQKLNFIQEFSDYLESNDILQQNLINKLEDNFHKQKIFGQTWNQKIDKKMFQEMNSYRKYNYSSIRDLIRVMRNKKNHFHELSQNLKNLFELKIQGIFWYFDARFPKLFIYIYNFTIKNNVPLNILEYIKYQVR